MNDDDLRNAFQQAAGNHRPSHDLLHRSQLAAAERRRRRDTALATVGGAAFSLIVFMGAFAIGNSSGPSNANDSATIALAEHSREEPAPQEAASNLAPSKDRPAAVIGASVAGRLVSIDSITGKTQRLLTEVKHPDGSGNGGLIGGVSLTPDSKSVYFDVHTDSSCGATIRQIPLAGGTATTVVTGSTPEIDPSGARLAYVRQTSCNQIAIVVRTLADGNERLLTTRTSTQPQSVVALSWSANGSRLIADVRSTDFAGNRLVILDSTKTLAFESLPVLAPSNDARNGTTFEWPSFLPDGHLFLSQRCCSTGPGNNAQQESQMLIVDDAGKTQNLIAYGLLDRSHTSTASDTAGLHLLYLSGTDLMVSDERSRPSRIATGLLGATWR